MANIIDASRQRGCKNSIFHRYNCTDSQESKCRPICCLSAACMVL